MPKGISLIEADDTHRLIRLYARGIKFMIDINTKERSFFLIRSLSVFFFLMICVSGCSLGNGIKHYIRPGLDINTINKVAVLPFENFTAGRFADDKIKSLVVIELLSRGVDVVEPGEVMRLLREMKVRSLDSITIEHIKEIGQTFKVQAVMTGSVGVFKVSRGAVVSYPEVSISLILYDAETSDIIWSIWHTTGGAGFWTRQFGAEGKTLDETAKILINDVIDTIY